MIFCFLKAQLEPQQTFNKATEYFKQVEVYMSTCTNYWAVQGSLGTIQPVEILISDERSFLCWKVANDSLRIALKEGSFCRSKMQNASINRTDLWDPIQHTSNPQLGKKKQPLEFLSGLTITTYNRCPCLTLITLIIQWFVVLIVPANLAV